VTGLRRCGGCGRWVLVATHDSGMPLRLELQPDPHGWLEVWVEDGRYRVSGLAHHVGGVRYGPHLCDQR
jgi:hypothetical protein